MPDWQIAKIATIWCEISLLVQSSVSHPAWALLFADSKKRPKAQRMENENCTSLEKHLPEQVWNKLLRIKKQIFLFSICTKCDFKYTVDTPSAVSQSFWAITNKTEDMARTHHWEVEDIKFKLIVFLNIRLMNSSTKYQENKLLISRCREDTFWKKCSSKLLALCYQLSAGVSK